MNLYFHVFKSSLCISSLKCLLKSLAHFSTGLFVLYFIDLGGDYKFFVSYIGYKYFTSAYGLSFSL